MRPDGLKTYVKHGSDLLLKLQSPVPPTIDYCEECELEVRLPREDFRITHCKEVEELEGGGYSRTWHHII